MKWVALLLVCAWPMPALSAPSNGDPADRFGPRNALHLPPLSIHAFGGMLEYERYALPSRSLSVAARLGARSVARGDFGGLGLAGGLELRLWPAQRFVAFKTAPRMMAGPYLALSLDAAGSGLRDPAGARVGHQLALALGTLVGYRMLMAWGLVGTLYGGLLFQRSWLFDGRSAGAGTVRPTWGFTLGWMF